VPTILRELQSTNLLYPSEDLSLWSSSATLISGQLSPEGDLSAFSVVVGSFASKRLFPNNSSGTLDALVEPSFYIKKVDVNGILIVESANGNALGRWIIDLSLIDNGWVWINKTHVSVEIINPFRFHPTVGTCKILFYSGNTSNSDLAFKLWGAQLEQGSIASSYIPTNGTTVTRLADNISVPTPAGVTSITETIDGVEQSPITTIPTTYSLPVGNINKVKML